MRQQGEVSRRGLCRVARRLGEQEARGAAQAEALQRIEEARQGEATQRSEIIGHSLRGSIEPSHSASTSLTSTTGGRCAADWLRYVVMTCGGVQISDQMVWMTYCDDALIALG